MCGAVPQPLTQPNVAGLSQAQLARRMETSQSYIAPRRSLMWLGANPRGKRLATETSMAPTTTAERCRGQVGE